ncbi:hypothetical protein Bbelb_011800 [Branchiostoma belcheri]|nr:hypothetical protein Bbelb_011800 [Branchiostoma belcheri]
MGHLFQCGCHGNADLSYRDKVAFSLAASDWKKLWISQSAKGLQLVGLNRKILEWLPFGANSGDLNTTPASTPVQRTQANNGTETSLSWTCLPVPLHHLLCGRKTCPTGRNCVLARRLPHKGKLTCPSVQG